MNDATRQQRVCSRAAALVQQQPIYLDTETTGLSPTDEVIEICLLNHDGSVLVESLVKPVGRVSSDALRIHQISDAMLNDAPGWKTVWPLVQQALQGRQVAIYNANFDMRIMQQSHQQHGLVWRKQDCASMCIMQMYAEFFGQPGRASGTFAWQSLDKAVKQCKLRLTDSRHRAQADALAARSVLLHMAEQK